MNREPSSPPSPSQADASERFPSNRPSLWAALVDLVAVKTCGGCGRPPSRNSALCRGCAETLAEAAPRRAYSTRGRVYAAAHYEDPVRSMVIQFKERARSDLARPLGSALARSVLAHVDAADSKIARQPAARPGAMRAANITRTTPVTLVPMPSTRKATRRRGDDTTARLARAAAADLRRAGLPIRTLPVLRHTRRVADQAGLDHAARAANLAGALTVPRRWVRHLDGAVVVLVDDVVTTGATLNEAARVVRLAGADVVGGAVVAAARFVR